MSNEQYSPQLEENDTINIRAELEKYLIHWKWFALGVLLTLIGAFLFLRYSTPKYSASTTILIKNDKQGGISEELAAFEDLGIVGGSSKNIDNEIEIIKSRKLINDVIQTLNLNISYLTEGRIKESEVYKNSPIIFTQIDSSSTALHEVDTTFNVEVLSADRFRLKDINGYIISENEFNQTIESTTLGSFKIEKSSVFKDEKTGNAVKIAVRSINKVIDGYQQAINIAPISKKSSVLKLSLQSSIKKKLKTS